MAVKLVSIISPCFNSTEYLHKLLNSILQQDYPNIEVILVDDGSKDNLKDYLIEHGYFIKFEEKGFRLQYFYQENNGQASAINLGLKHYKGDYLTWPDSDDYYNTGSAISTFVTEIERGDYDMVRCFPNHVDDKGAILDFIIPTYSDKNILNDCLLENNFWFSPICYFFKSKVIVEVLNNKILPSKVGQNFQFYIPLFYYGKMKTMEVPLVNYLVRANSHSHAKKSLIDAVKRLSDIYLLKLQIISHYKLNVNSKVLYTLKRKMELSKLRLYMEHNELLKGVKIILSRLTLSAAAYRIFLSGIIKQMKTNQQGEHI